MSSSAAFAEHASGLVVPQDLARTRKVWTKQEGKILDRFVKLVKAKGLEFHLRCADPKCQTQPLEPKMLAGRQFRLRCRCTDHVMVRDF